MMIKAQIADDNDVSQQYPMITNQAVHEQMATQEFGTRVVHHYIITMVTMASSYHLSTITHPSPYYCVMQQTNTRRMC